MVEEGTVCSRIETCLTLRDVLEALALGAEFPSTLSTLRPRLIQPCKVFSESFTEQRLKTS